MNEMKEWAKGALQGEAMTYLKGLSAKVKQIALNLSDIEIQVEEATSLEPWGPHGSAMADITKASYDIESYRQIMGVVARRLQSEGPEWRHVYKSLLLLEYMAKHGPQKVVEELVSNVGVIEKLASFQHKDANGKDWGLNVRERARQLAALVTDPERIRAEREKAKANAAKYTGVSSDEMRSSGFGRTTFGGGGLGSTSGGGASSRYGGFGGSSGSTGLGGAASYDDNYEAKDPREATRERIERLKDQYREADAPGEAAAHATTAPAAAPTRLGAGRPPRLAGGDAAVSEAAVPRGPKKLSDVRVNPSIAASLGALPLPAAAPRSAAPAASASSNAVADLLGGLNGAAPPPTAPPPAARSAPDLLGGLGGVGAAPAGGAGGWDAFAAAGAGPAPGAAAAPGAGWPAFEAAPRPPQPAAAALDDPFGLAAPAAAPAALALREGDPFAGAGLGAAAQLPAAQPPSASGGGGRGALPQDLFSLGAPAPARPASLSSLPSSAPQPLGGLDAPGGEFGPFGAAVAPAFGSLPLAQPAAAAPGPAGRPSLGFGAPGADLFAQPPAPAPGFVAFPAPPVQVGPGVGKSAGNMANLPAPPPAKKDPFADLAF